MFRRTTVAAAAAAAAAAALSLAFTSHAHPMTYTHQVNASGQLNGQAFTNTDVTITLRVESTNFAWDPAGNIAIGFLVDTSRNEVAGIGIDSFSNIVSSRACHA